MNGERPLTGVRVLDLTRLLPGGLCTLVLADLGADVIKVEAPGSGDYARNREPFRESSEPSTASMTFVGLNRDKRSVVLDLKHDRGRAAFLDLVRDADVVVESFRPGVLDRLRLGLAELSRVNPRVVLCSLSGWGQRGAWARRAGHDVNYLAATGLLSPTGAVDDPPVLSAQQVSDSSGGLVAALSILAALHSRDRSNRGQHIDVSLAHSALLMSAMAVASTLGTGTAAATRSGLFSGGVVCYQTYRCRDGWVALGALEAKFWQTWCAAVERPDLIEHRYDATGTATHAQVAAIFAEHDREYWRRFADRHDCCLTVVEGLASALASDLLAGFVRPLVQPGVDDPVPVLALPVVFAGTDLDPGRLPAPALGEHTAELCPTTTLKEVHPDA